MNATTPPCFEIQTINQNIVEDPDERKKKGKKDKKKENEFKLVLEFKNQQYKELRWQHPFDIVALISNIGIYVGLFFGFLLQWQGPEVFIAALATIRGLFSRRPKVIPEQEIIHAEDAKLITEEIPQADDEDVETKDLSSCLKNIHFIKLDGEQAETIMEKNSDDEIEKVKLE